MINNLYILKSIMNNPGTEKSWAQQPFTSYISPKKTIPKLWTRTFLSQGRISFGTTGPPGIGIMKKIANLGCIIISPVRNQGGTKEWLSLTRELPSTNTMAMKGNPRRFTNDQFSLKTLMQPIMLHSLGKIAPFI